MTAMGVSSVDEDVIAARLSHLLASLEQGVVVHAPDGSIIGSNEAAQRLLALSEDQLTGRTPTDPLWSVVSPDGSPFPGEEHPASVSLRTGEPVQGVVMGVRTPNGRTTWLRVNTEPVRDPRTGQVREVIATFTCVDTEQALARSEARFRRLAENASDVVCQTDADWRIEWVSPSVARVLGWEPAALVGTSSEAVVLPADLPVLQAERARLAAGEIAEVAGVIVRYLTADGDVRWMSTSVGGLHDDEGRLVGAVVGLRDIDELVRARAAAEAGEATLRAHMDAMIDPQVVVEPVVDPDGAVVDFRYVEANRAACEYLSLPRNEIVGRTLLETFPGTSASGLLDGLTSTLRSGDPLVWDDWLYRNEILDSERWYDLRAATTGDMLGLTWRDVTERHDAEEALARSEARYRVLTENMKDVVWVLDVETLRFVYMSPSVEALRGYTAEEVMAASAEDALTPEGAAWLRAYLDSSLAALGDGREPFDVFRTEVFPQPCKDGSMVWTEVNGRFHRDEATGRIEVWAVTRDISERRAATEALARSEERYRLLAENASDVVAQADRDGTLLWVSESVSEHSGWTPEDLVGRPFLDLVHPDDRAAAAGVVVALARGDTGAVEARIRTASGDWRWFDFRARPVLDESGALVGGVAGARDIQDQVEARAALQRSEQRFRLAMESAPTGMAVVDLDRRFVEVNPALCRMLGREEEWLLAHRIPDVLPRDDDPADIRMRAEVLTGLDRSGSRTHRLLRADGAVLVVEQSVGVLRDESGVPMSYVSMFVDVTEARRAQEQLSFLASHDALTSLANRHELTARMAQILHHPPRTGTRLAVLFLDLDDFKPVNDTYGHGVGDRLLVEVARLVQDQVRSGDLVARVGGDEFVVLLPAVRDVADAVVIAEKIHRALADPVTVDGHELRVSTSIGIAVADHGDDAERVVLHADQALYRAKREGRHRTATYEPSA